jgi:23S rRNA (cytidine1920-2'-O)/16S rRNA (cytidine1409-2'-O)-methyltransferase
MKRLDQWLVEEGIYPSRERARLAVMAGEVEVEGKGRALKASYRLGPADRVTVKSRKRFVSRGGDKLDGALSRLGVEVRGRNALDIGASTGGFAHCLLERGASRVVCLDVGRGLLHWDMRNDERVTVIEGFNARFLKPADLPYVPGLVVADLSFISLRLVIEALSGVLEEGGDLIALVKPQFEAGKGKVGRKGIVRDPEVHREILDAVVEAAGRCPLALQGIVPSPLRGGKGNIEYFAWWKKQPDDGGADTALEVEGAVKEAWTQA